MPHACAKGTRQLAWFGDLDFRDRSALTKILALADENRSGETAKSKNQPCREPWVAQSVKQQARDFH